MGCFISKKRQSNEPNLTKVKQNRLFVEKKGVSFEDRPIKFENVNCESLDFKNTTLHLDLNLILSDFTTNKKLTPSLRRIKHDTRLIKRHSAPEAKRGAFSTGLRLNILNNLNVYHYPETFRQQQLSGVLNTIDDLLQNNKLKQECKQLLNCLRTSLFNSEVDSAVAKKLVNSIKSCQLIGQNKLYIEISRQSDMFYTQFLLSENELKVVSDLVNCVPHVFHSINLAQFQISSLKLAAFSKIISQCKCLQELSLRGCSLDNNFIQRFTKTTKSNSLKKLDISSNFVGDAGLVSLGKFMVSSKSKLIELNITDNFFTTTAVIYFGLLVISSTNWNVFIKSDALTFQDGVGSALSEIYTMQYTKRQLHQSYKLQFESQKLIEKSPITEMLKQVTANNHSVTFDISSLKLLKNDNSNRSKSISDVSNFQKLPLTFGFYTTKGRRPQMEDFVLVQPCFRNNSNESLYGVFDGHGGFETGRVVSFALSYYVEKELNKIKPKQTSSHEINETYQNNSIKQALDKAFELTQQLLESCNIPHGACALLVYINSGQIYTANSGDSQVLLLDQTKKSGHYDSLAIIKRPTDSEEQHRIEAANGLVLRGRVDGTVAVSRALGDIDYQPKITYKPILTERVVSTSSGLKILVMATDGLWDVLSYEEVSTLVFRFFKQEKKLKRRHSLRTSNSLLKELKRCPDLCWKLSKCLVDTSLARNSTDNVSVICVMLSTK